MLGKIKLKQFLFMLWYASWNHGIFHPSGVNCHIKKIYLKDKSMDSFSGSETFWREHFLEESSFLWKNQIYGLSAGQHLLSTGSAQDIFMSFLSTTRSDVFGHNAWKWQWVLGLTLAVTDVGSHPCSCHQNVETEAKEKTLIIKKL